jgi:hypothetical protein
LRDYLITLICKVYLNNHPQRWPEFWSHELGWCHSHISRAMLMCNWCLGDLTCALTLCYLRPFTSLIYKNHNLFNAVS